MMPFEIVILATDAIFFLLIICFLLLILWQKKNAQAAAWAYVWRSPIGMGSFVVLFFYLSLAFLDSLHFHPRLKDTTTEQGVVYSAQIHSVLDVMLSPLDTQMEKTYAAPFSQKGFIEEPVEINGVVTYVYPHLTYTAGDKKISHIMLTALPPTLVLWFLSMLLIFFMAAKGSLLRVRVLLRQVVTWHSNGVCWRTLIVTLGIMLFTCVSLFYLSRYYHIFGTDKIGQDVFYQAVKSIRTGVMIGTLTTLVMLPFALLMGTLAGYFRGVIDDVIQYIYTTLSSIPSVLLIAASVLMLEVFINNHPDWFLSSEARADARLLALCVILGITSWTSLCRLIRAETLKLRELDYVLAAKALGVRHFSIILQHILPNVMHIILITIVLDFSGLVLAEAVLSYIGVGVDPSMQSFGNMINSARLELAREPVIWWSLAAAFIFMFVLVLAANLFADIVRDAFDPRVRQSVLLEGTTE